MCVCCVVHEAYAASGAAFLIWHGVRYSHRGPRIEISRDQGTHSRVRTSPDLPRLGANAFCATEADKADEVSSVEWRLDEAVSDERADEAGDWPLPY